MIAKITFIFLFIITLIPIHAGRETGLDKEFRRHEEKALGDVYSPKQRQKLLNRNLISALRSLILRRLYNKKEEYFKSLTIANIAYDNPTSPYTYYVKYKDFMARLEYELNPKVYVQNPKAVKFIFIKKEGKDTKASVNQ